MNLVDIYSGRATWADYLQSASSATLSERRLATGDLPEESGPGIDRLKSDFDLALGDLFWKSEMTSEALSELLAEVRLAEFEREARAYRARAERAYLNGWYDEALEDFLEAAKRNYPDFSVHRSIATLYMYHFNNLPGALEYYSKAAKYSRPSDARQCAESHYFAGVVCALLERFDDATTNFAVAASINPSLSDAHYQSAVISAIRGDREKASDELESACRGDSRYLERAAVEGAFDSMRFELDSIVQKVNQHRFKYQYSVDPREFIRSVTFSADGLLIAAGLMNGSVQAWFAESGERAYSVQVHLASINSLAFSPDMYWLATGSRDRTIKLLEADSGQEVRAFKGHLGEVRSVSFSPCGQWLASASHDRSVRLWRVATGGEVEVFCGHTQQVTAAVFSPCGRFIASGSWDRTVKVWESESGRLVRTMRRHAHGVGAIAFSSDAKMIASGGEDGQVFLWNAMTGELFRQLKGHINAINSLAFNPDGRLLASGCLGRSTILWNVENGDIIKRVRHSDISYHSVAFSPRGEWLALGSRGLELWVKALSHG
jgi:WD40 repeat protein